MKNVTGEVEVSPVHPKCGYFLGATSKVSLFQ